MCSSLSRRPVFRVKRQLVQSTPQDTCNGGVMSLASNVVPSQSIPLAPHHLLIDLWQLLPRYLEATHKDRIHLPKWDTGCDRCLI